MKYGKVLISRGGSTTRIRAIGTVICALIPEQAKKFYDQVKSDKQLVWGTGYDFNFYDIFSEMMQAVGAVVPFMRKHLAPQTVSRASRNRARTVVAAIK